MTENPHACIVCAVTSIHTKGNPMKNTRSRGVIASFTLIIWCALMACQPSVPVRQVYLPADCPLPTAQHHAISETPLQIETPPLKSVKPARDAPASPPSSPTASPSALQAPSTLVDLNTATSLQLQSLPGIGPAMAKRILERRATRRFKRVRDLKRVRGIGPATYGRLKALVQVSKAPTPQVSDTELQK